MNKFHNCYHLRICERRHYINWQIWISIDVRLLDIFTFINRFIDVLPSSQKIQPFFLNFSSNYILELKICFIFAPRYKAMRNVLLKCGRGGIGRHARLRIWCLTVWKFESSRPYFIKELTF